MTEAILSNLLYGLFGLFLGNRLRIGTEAAGRRRNFRDCISRITEDVRNAPEDELRRLYESSVDTVRAESIIITEDIHRLRRSKFGKAWHAYCSRTGKDFSKTNKWIADLARTPGLEFDYELVKDTLLRELQRIVKYAA